MFTTHLLIASLKNWQVTGNTAPGTPIRIGRGRFRRLLRLVDDYRWAAGNPVNTIKTQIPVQPMGQPKGKYTLLCDLSVAPERRPLFEVTPATIQEIAREIRLVWGASSTND